MRSIGREERSRPTDSCNSYLLRLYDALRPRHESFVWSGWVLAITLLGLETLSDVVRRAFGGGLIDAMLMGYEPFREDLGRTLADPERMAGFRHDRIGPLEDAVGELSGWSPSPTRRSGTGRGGPRSRPSTRRRGGRPSTRTSTSTATTLARAAAGRSSRSAACPGCRPRRTKARGLGVNSHPP